MAKTNVSRYDTLRWMLAGVRAEATRLANDPAAAVQQDDLRMALDLFNTGDLMAWSLASRGLKGAGLEHGALGMMSTDGLEAPPEGGYESFGFPSGVEIESAENVRKMAAHVNQARQQRPGDLLLA